MEYSTLLITFFSVFLVNLIPIFGPPTWTVLSLIAFFYPATPFFLLVGIGVISAAIGRAGLTSLSRHVIRNRFLSPHARENIDHLRVHLERKPLVASTIFLLDALTPFPSDQLFIAYGLTKLPLRYAIIPFMCGRLVTYSFWVYTARVVSQAVTSEGFSVWSLFSWPVIIIELVLLFFVYLFVRLDWEYLILHRGVRFYTRS